MSELTTIAPRIPYRPAAQNFDVDESQWYALCDAVFPAAKTADGIMLALAYCKRRNLDPFKRPVHIVPIWDASRKRMVETVWPGINELRTTAFRTGKYAGCDPAEFGPDAVLEYTLPVKGGNDDGGHPNAPPSDDQKPKAAPQKRTLTYPTWCQITVYRLVEGQRIAFPGPRVYWLESYATAGRNTDAPNEMWGDRVRGQLEKVAEAAALRKAFPEELAGEYSIDEAPRMVDITPGPEPVPERRPTRADAKKVNDDLPSSRTPKKSEAKVAEPDDKKIPVGDNKPTLDNDEPKDDAPSEAFAAFIAELKETGSIQSIDEIKGRAKAALSKPEFSAFMNEFLAQQRRF